MTKTFEFSAPPGSPRKPTPALLTAAGVTAALLLPLGTAAPAAAAPAALNEPVHVATYAGVAPDLPTEVEVTTDTGESEMAPVDWAVEDFTFARHYQTVVVPGTVDGELPVTAKVEVIPAGTAYFIDSGLKASTPPFDAVASLSGDALLNETADQQSTADSWGYVNDGGAYVAARNGAVEDKDETGLYALGRGSTSQPILYNLPLEAGTYTATAGFREWWNGPRSMDVSVVSPGGEATIIGDDVTVDWQDKSTDANKTRMASDTFTVAEAGTVQLRVELASGTEAPVLGWLGIARGEVNVDTTPLMTEAPTFSPTGGTFGKAQTVALATATEGATIHYTTDGSAPSSGSPAYEDPLTIAETTTVKAVAVKEGVSSSVGSATFTIEPVPEGGYEYVPVGKTWFDTDGNSIQAHGGGFLQHEGWYYWVGENKSHNSATLLSVNLYRSQDLKNWEFVNDILTPQSMPDCGPQPNQPKLSSCKIERPKLVYNEATGKFVLWGHWETADSYAASQLIVATSDTIGGDYEFVRHYRPGVGEVETAHADPTYQGGDNLWGYGSRDFTVFKDPDSADAYLVSAEDHENMRMYKLTDDYTDVDWENSYTLFPGGHREAPALVKVDGQYVLITSGQSGWYPNQAYYATSNDISNPDGWSELKPLGNNTTFYSQPTNVMTIEGTVGERSYIYMGDRWNRHALGSSTYVWLPLEISADGVDMDFRPQWTFDAATGSVQYPAEELVSEGKPVQAQEADAAFPPSAANDGNLFNLRTSGDNTNYYKPAGVPFDWTVDLGEATDLSRIDLAFRSYNGSETYSAYTVSASNDGETWEQLVDATANRTVGFTSHGLAGDYRYVRVDVSNVVNDHNGNGAAWAAGLVEVQVYAHGQPAFAPVPVSLGDDSSTDFGLGKQKFNRGAQDVTLGNLAADEWLFVYLNDAPLGWQQVSDEGTVTIATPEDTKPGNNRMAVYDDGGILLGWDRLKVVGP